MNEFKQWYENKEDLIQFHTQSQIYFCQCDKNHQLSLFELLRMVTDAAVEDFTQRAMDYNALTDKGIGILVSRQSFRFHKMPRGNQKITIKTWEEKPEPLQFTRSYEIYDSDTNECLVSGDSRWLLVDLEKRRLMPIKNFTMRVPPQTVTEHDCLPPAKIELPENAVMAVERPIWYSDIDGNGHTNNARYGAFVIDVLPDEYRSKQFTDFKINFSQEAMLGQRIQLYISINDAEKKITVFGKQDSVLCFESELFWK